VPPVGLLRVPRLAAKRLGRFCQVVLQRDLPSNKKPAFRPTTEVHNLELNVLHEGSQRFAVAYSGYLRNKGVHMSKKLEYTLSTKEFAELALVAPASIKTRVKSTGNYYGITPKTLPNGRLVWPSNAKQQLSTEYALDTKAFAKLVLVKPATIKARVRSTGSYYGVRPKKLPSGKFVWARNAQEQLFTIAEQKAAKQKAMEERRAAVQKAMEERRAAVEERKRRRRAAVEERAKERNAVVEERKRRRRDARRAWRSLRPKEAKPVKRDPMFDLSPPIDDEFNVNDLTPIRPRAAGAE
jgi:hypothetical protein